MKPSKKSPEMEASLTRMFGDRVQPITNNTCFSCKKPATEFRDPLSRKEFSISGLCQKCQDEVFGV